MPLLTEGQTSDHIGAKLLYPRLPEAKTLIADKGYDSQRVVGQTWQLVTAVGGT